MANWKTSSHFVPKINRMHTDIQNNIFQMSGELTDHEAIVSGCCFQEEKTVHFIPGLWRDN